MPLLKQSARFVITMSRHFSWTRLITTCARSLWLTRCRVDPSSVKRTRVQPCGSDARGPAVRADVGHDPAEFSGAGG